MLGEKIKNIFFDLDNTLWDFKKNSLLTLQELYNDFICAMDTERIGPQRFIEIFAVQNDRLWEDYRKGSIDKDRLRALRFKNTLDTMGIDGSELACSMEEEFVVRTSYKPNLVDNAVEILDYLYGRYKLGIITNGFMEAQEIKLKNCGLSKYFKHVIVSEVAGVSKPNTAIFDYTVSCCSLSKDETVYIGDDYNVDMVCAINSGVKGIWLNRNDEKNLNNGSCIEIKNLLELKDIF